MNLLDSFGNEKVLNIEFIEECNCTCCIALFMQIHIPHCVLNFQTPLSYPFETQKLFHSDGNDGFDFTRSRNSASPVRIDASAVCRFVEHQTISKNLKNRSVNSALDSLVKLKKKKKKKEKKKKIWFPSFSINGGCR